LSVQPDGGASFRAAFDAHPVTRIHAVCDIREEALPEAAERLGASEMYTSYEALLASSDMDAVVIGTPDREPSGKLGIAFQE
jgi:predicted dehydrogenase